MNVGKLNLNWRHAAGELAIVAVGVVLGLAANGWIAGVGLRRAESAALMRLADDMGTDIRELSGDRNRTQRGYKAAVWLMRHRDGPLPPEDSLNAALTDFTACSAMSVNTSEYTALKASGQLSLLRDATFRQRMVNHYERYPYLSYLFDQDCTAMEAAISSVESEVRFGIDSTGEVWPVFLSGDAGALLHNATFQRSVAFAARMRDLRTPLEKDVIAELDSLRTLATHLAGR